MRFVVPERNIAIEDITLDISNVGNQAGFLSREMSSKGPLFSFDPNTATYDNLIKLGLTGKETNTLINYRNKGGRFRIPSDIKKVYGIDEVQASKLIPFVEMATDTVVKARSNSFGQQKALLDLNTCDSASLVRLPGIGPVLSARIIKYRRLLGGFATINQLKEVYGLPPETIDRIKSRVYADSSAVLKIMINSADYKELSRLPYFEKYEVTAILKYRELKGKLISISDLVENKLITDEKAQKVICYLRFD